MKQLWISILFLIFSCEAEQELAEQKTETATKRDSISVRVVKLQKSAIQDYIKSNAKLEAKRELTIFSQVTGTLRSSRENGDYIKAGESIFDIDGDLFYQQFKAAEAQEKFAFKNAEKAASDLKKYKELLSKQDISQDEYARHELSALQANQNYQAALLARKQAQKNYQNANYRAPFSGYLGQINLLKSQQIMQGEALAKLADMSSYRCVLSLSLDEINRIKKADSARFDGSNFSLTGFVKSRSPIADSRTGSFLVELRFNADPKKKIVSGQYGTIRIFGRKYSDAFVLPQDIILLKDGEEFLFKVVDGKSVKTKVTVLHRIGKKVIVSGDLHENDQIISSAIGRMSADLIVTIIK